MSRHSKNNTARGFFTYAERQMLDYGTKTKRIGRDSKRNFDDCYLCLQPSRDPLTCKKGHLACRECIYSSILSQKEEIKRQKDEYAAKLAQNQKIDVESSNELALVRQQQFIESATFKKPKSTQGSNSKQTGKGEQRINNFWVPNLSSKHEDEDSGKINVKMPTKASVVCTASKPHKLKMKDLISVIFKENNKSSSGKSCPACTKQLHNSMKLMVMGKCGHVLCAGCYLKFVVGEKRCYVCGEDVNTAADADSSSEGVSGGVVVLDSEGTGFAGGGGSTSVSKYDLGFTA